jgi:ABC-type spermidine/putrescine transport system permease subunit I
VALLIAYPAAYAIALGPRRRQPLLLVLVTLPFWSNYLIRTYAWIVLLNREIFVLSIGNFVTPNLLGGGRLQMVGNLIYDQFLTARDWPFGATLAGILILLMLSLLALQARLVGRERPT